MAKLGFCRISNLKLSLKSKRAVSDVKSIIDGGNLLSSALSVTPIAQIFMSPSVTGSLAETGITIAEYDWNAFASAMRATSQVTRERIRNIAEPQTWYTTGSEQKFWRCVSEAAL
ncbi:hypothetical protein [Moritella viscosa]|uniref:hypothetical protein n=1 Tax=Moritella viscosa TaxID=80854 RepID=UPI00092302AE|nr:hypothetical protein [Moritella viscosa]SHO17365.1 Putative uncharacterized protein [Moritella viscosa]